MAESQTVGPQRNKHNTAECHMSQAGDKQLSETKLDTTKETEDILNAILWTGVFKELTIV